jgi:hypothetical protein
LLGDEVKSLGGIKTVVPINSKDNFIGSWNHLLYNGVINFEFGPGDSHDNCSAIQSSDFQTILKTNHTTGNILKKN